MAESAHVLIEVTSTNKPWANVISKNPDGGVLSTLRPMDEGERVVVPRDEALKLTKRDGVSGMRHAVIIGDAS